MTIKDVKSTSNYDIRKNFVQDENARGTDFFVKMICSTYMPINIVENEEFKEWVGWLNKKIKLPTREALTKMISNKAASSRQALKEILRNKSVSLTLDKWSSRSQHSYLGVTAHYIDDNWELCKVTLQCKRCNTPESRAQDILTLFNNVLSDYNISFQNIVCVVSDTEATMNSFGDLIEGLDVYWVGCVCHILDLVSKNWIYKKDSLPAGNGMIDALARARALVGHFHHADKKMQKLQEIYEKKQAKDPQNLAPWKKPKEDCRTRWWSTYNMLQSLIPLRLSIVVLSEDCENNDPLK